MLFLPKRVNNETFHARTEWSTHAALPPLLDLLHALSLLSTELLSFADRGGPSGHQINGQQYAWLGQRYEDEQAWATILMVLAVIRLLARTVGANVASNRGSNRK